MVCWLVRLAVVYFASLLRIFYWHRHSNWRYRVCRMRLYRCISLSVCVWVLYGTPLMPGRMVAIQEIFYFRISSFRLVPFYRRFFFRKCKRIYSRFPSNGIATMENFQLIMGGFCPKWKSHGNQHFLVECCKCIGNEHIRASRLYVVFIVGTNNRTRMNSFIFGLTVACDSTMTCTLHIELESLRFPDVFGNKCFGIGANFQLFNLISWQKSWKSDINWSGQADFLRPMVSLRKRLKCAMLDLSQIEYIRYQRDGLLLLCGIGCVHVCLCMYACKRICAWMSDCQWMCVCMWLVYYDSLRHVIPHLYAHTHTFAHTRTRRSNENSGNSATTEDGKGNKHCRTVENENTKPSKSVVYVSL